MTDVLLATSYFLKHDPKQVQKMRPYPPLATLCVASYLRATGYSVALFDAMLSQGEHEFAAALAQHQPCVVALFEDNFNFLSKMCLTRMREAALAMITMAREMGAFVVAAGSDVTDHPDLYLAQGAHFTLVGEGDHTLMELMRELEIRDRRSEIEKSSIPQKLSVADFQSIAGLAYHSDGGVLRTAKRVPERRPDVFPLPAWDLINVEQYRAVWQEAHGFFSLNMASTRGCPFHCNWCAKPIWGQRYAMRSPANVAEEMALLKRTHKPDHIWFADDIFGLRPQWVADFAHEVEVRDAAIPFMIQSRADLMTEQAVAGLKRAGCAEVWMGAESGSQKVLDAMDKGTKVEQVKLARNRLGEAGIKACFFIQFGYPGETFEDVMLTVQLVRQALPDNIGVSVSYPLPGTRFHDMVKAQLGEKTNWTDSDELAMMFTGTYQTPFYKKLHHVLHADLEFYQLKHRYPNRSQLVERKTALDREWAELMQLERQYRNDLPTVIVKPYDRLEMPDLSREWN